jgi:hypothetical protein
MYDVRWKREDVGLSSSFLIKNLRIGGIYKEL